MIHFGASQSIGVAYVWGIRYSYTLRDGGGEKVEQKALKMPHLYQVGSNGDKKFLKDLGKRLRRARKAKGWGQEYVASLVGCSQPNISDYEHGKISPPILRFLRLSEHLDVDMYELVGQKRPRFGMPKSQKASPIIRLR